MKAAEDKAKGQSGREREDTEGECDGRAADRSTGTGRDDRAVRLPGDRIHGETAEEGQNNNEEFWKCTDRANPQWRLPRNWG